jgi:hypothetical protein
MMADCEICNGKRFVRDAHDNVTTCPACNEDGAFAGDVWELEIQTTPFEEDEGAGDS